MAVQAQYPSNPISPDFLLSRVAAGSGRTTMDANGLLMYNGNGGAVLSDPQSQLTTTFNHPASTMSMSMSRKRNRDELMPLPSQFQYQLAPNPSDVHTRVLESAGASTSGRLITAPGLLAAHLSHEVDFLLRQHNERLRVGLEESVKRHCSVLHSVLEKQFLASLQEKQAELHKAVQRNLELEVKVRQLNAEKEMWFTAAKNSEAIVAGLKESLEQALLINQAVTKECGDVSYPAAEDEESFCLQGEEKDRRLASGVGVDVEEGIGESPEMVCQSVIKCCRVCQERDVCVLLLPCKHLCLCKDCASALDTCPVCRSPKNASLHVIIPHLQSPL
ncbi:putative E3 ubiquitin ligase protein [Dioscorea alata]|uniref:E3 ubiquitin ligase protein n=1 Tax=Dioscorea alata TaxID=55571 RepID=A0ACB7V902_DIOAL|nr:putative E3 ubiquitin ligase protein [Dioscorea alata]